jgi:DNA polymerase III delta prime subunit
VASPKKEEIGKVLEGIEKKENLKLPKSINDKIVEKCDRNLRRAIFMLELISVENR